MKNIKYSIILLLLVACKKKDAEKKNVIDNFNELILSENKVGKEYQLQAMEEVGFWRYDVIYIGKMATKKDSLKFMYCVLTSGINDSPSANSRLYVYDKNNKKLGHYYIGGAGWQVPFKIIGSSLLFPGDGPSCDQTTLINFNDSIPKEIFVDCNKKGGDFWGYTEE